VSTDLEPNSSVEANFRTDQVPLDHMTSADKVALIRANTLNPAAEARAAETARRGQAATADQARRSTGEWLLAQPEPPPAPNPGPRAASRPPGAPRRTLPARRGGEEEDPAKATPRQAPTGQQPKAAPRRPPAGRAGAHHLNGSIQEQDDALD
jgi:hypothetical protein